MDGKLHIVDFGDIAAQQRHHADVEQLLLEVYREAGFDDLTPEQHRLFVALVKALDFRYRFC